MPRIALSCLILLTNLGLLVACKKEKLETLQKPKAHSVLAEYSRI